MVNIRGIISQVSGKRRRGAGTGSVSGRPAAGGRRAGGEEQVVRGVRRLLGGRRR